MGRSHRYGCLLALGLVACDPEVDRPDAGTGSDATVKPPPAAPLLDGVIGLAPYAVATLRGESVGRRVIVEGAGSPLASTVLPDGTFCIDVPLRQPGTYGLHVFAQGEDGQLSIDSAMAQVTFDPSASPVPGASTCSGADPAGCSGAVEICDNNRDDDCNSLTDGDDPACAQCSDDILEPNDDLSAPRLEIGRYEDLAICPGNQDVYGVYLRAGETLTARIFFGQAAGNLDMQLLADDYNLVLARANSITDDEIITYTSSAAQELDLLIYGEGGSSNSYTLDIGIQSGG